MLVALSHAYNWIIKSGITKKYPKLPYIIAELMATSNVGLQIEVLSLKAMVEIICKRCTCFSSENQY